MNLRPGLGRTCLVSPRTWKTRPTRSRVVYAITITRRALACLPGRTGDLPTGRTAVLAGGVRELMIPQVPS